jgi:uncharacterized membrane protein
MTARNLPRNHHGADPSGVVAPLPIFLLPAYTVLPFIRSPLGIGLVNPWNVIRRTLGLIILVPILEAILDIFVPSRASRDMGHVWLSIFALSYLVVSLVILARRWQGQRNGEEVHSAETGYSWLALRTKLPVGICEQLIVPLAIGILGYLIDHTFSVELGWWLMAAGVSLFILARWESRSFWAQHQGTVDDLIHAKSFEKRMERHETKQSGVTAGTPQDGPVFADLGDDISDFGEPRKR